MIEVTTLRRAEVSAELAAAMAVHRLIRVVGEWAPGAELQMSLHGATRERGAVLRFEQSGAEQQDWTGDLEWAVADLYELSEPAGEGPEREAPARVHELLPARLDSALSGLPTWDDAVDDDDSVILFSPPDRRGRPRLGSSATRTYFDDLSGIVATLGEDPRTSLMFRLAPADELEAELLGLSLEQSWPGTADALQRFLGQPVRLRTLVLSGPSGPSARLAAQLKQLAKPLVIRELTGRAARDAVSADPETLVAHAVPETLAGGLLRLPAAGNDGFPGFVTAHPAFEMRALDPMPEAPADPIPLGHAVSSAGLEQPFCLARPDLMRHLFFEGASGSGKSTALATLILALIRQGIGFTVLDPHGSLVDAILRLIPDREARRRLRVVRHGDHANPVPLNPLSGDPVRFQRALEAFIEMVQQWVDPKHEGFVGPRWRRWFTLVAQGCRVLWGGRVSLPLVVAVASDPARIGQLADRIAADAPELADRLSNEYGELSGKEATDLTSWAVSKLNPFVSSPMMRGILDRGVTAVDIAELMDDHGGLLIDLASPGLGDGSSRILGALWLQEHLLALADRADRTSPHVIIVDEAHLFTFGALPQLLAEGRKFGISLVIATQTVAALPDRFADGIESNSGGFVAFRSGLRNAYRASQRLEDWAVGELVRLPDLHAAATLSRDGVMTEPFTLRFDRMDQLVPPGMSAAERDEHAAEIEAESRAILSEPYRDLVPLSDEEVQARLRRPRPDGRPTESAEAWMARQRAKHVSAHAD